MSVSDVKLGRLLSYPFDSQVRSMQGRRAEQPDWIVAWFRQLEADLPMFHRSYNQLDQCHKDKFQALQFAYETLVEKPFAGAATRKVTTLPLSSAFQVLEDFASMVASKVANGILVVGPGGTGKTWTVLQTLDKKGLRSGQDYFRVPGYASPAGLYNYLSEHPDKLMVFDDCDSIFKDEHGLNILKSVLDTLPTRRVSWHSASPKINVPMFDFTGQIIFISNLDPAKATNLNFQALLTRVMTLVIGGSKEEMMMHIVSKMPEIAAELPHTQREEILQFLKDNYRQYNELSLRIAVHLVKLRKFSPNGWKEMAKALN